MSDPWKQPWSGFGGATAPYISKYEYTGEKAMLAGSFISSILYGLLTLLFFQCMAAFLNPVHRREEGIKWGFVCYTVAMFSFVTVYTAINLHIQSNSFIDNRQDTREYLPLVSGPLEYQLYVRKTVLGLIPNGMFTLNNWLADGLLIYRCYIIYSTSIRAIILPCLLYLASLGTGITMLTFQAVGLIEYTPFPTYPGIPYLSISVSLNVLLTLMIIIRLILHDRNIRAATWFRVGISGLYKAVSIMLIESCALFAVSSLVVVVAMVRGISGLEDARYPAAFVVDIFFPILAETQVIAPLLIIQRVANRSALTSHTITTEHAGSFNVRRQGEPAGRDSTPLSGYLKNSAAGCRKDPDEFGMV